MPGGLEIPELCKKHRQLPIYIESSSSTATSIETIIDIGSTYQLERSFFCIVWNMEQAGNDHGKMGEMDERGRHENFKMEDLMLTRWWFQMLFIFIPTWGNDPI